MWANDSKKWFELGADLILSFNQKGLSFLTIPLTVYLKLLQLQWSHQDVTILPTKCSFNRLLNPPNITLHYRFQLI